MTPSTTRTLSRADMFIALGLSTGKYRADVTNGVVYGPKGRVLSCPLTPRGYPAFTVKIDGVQATVLAHRFIAAAAWGIDAITDSEVGHWDGVPTNNRLSNLWLPANPSEHYRHDDSVKPKYKGGHTKRTWPPCAACGDPDGPILFDGRTPERVTGKRFGIAGKLCKRCYNLRSERDRRTSRWQSAIDIEPTVVEAALAGHPVRPLGQAERLVAVQIAKTRGWRDQRIADLLGVHTRTVRRLRNRRPDADDQQGYIECATQDEAEAVAACMHAGRVVTRRVHATEWSET